MTREEILKKAIDITTKDRNATHGAPERSFTAIAAVTRLNRASHLAFAPANGVKAARQP